jgi:DNA-binding transcriptional ArsR family regulator
MQNRPPQTPQNEPNGNAEAAIVSSFGPISESALGTGTEAPVVEEWTEALSDKQGFILLWAGAYRGPEAPEESLDWSWIQAGVSAQGEGDDDGPLSALLGPDAATWTERLLSPLSHEARIRIMQALWRGNLSSTALGEATSMSGGNLYYHLKELIHAKYVADVPDGYALTGLGRQLLLTLVLVASHVVRDWIGGGQVVRST